MKYIDYYKVLGVERNAAQDEISRAYKKLARKYHPDLNKNKDAEAKFKEINEAYEVLRDPNNRKRYDTLGANWRHGAPFEAPPGWGGEGVHFEYNNNPRGGFGGGFSDFFESLFGGLGGNRRSAGGGFNLEDLLGGSYGGGGSREEQSRSQDIESTLTIELEDAHLGARKSVELKSPDGSRRYEIRIPKGIRDGERIRLSGQGLPGRGKSKGDLYLIIHIAPHHNFRLEGDHLVVDVPVNAWDAALGAKIPIPTLDGEVQMTLPPGQSSGQRLRLKGKGLSRREGGNSDLYAELRVVVPKQLTKEQERLFIRLREISGTAAI